jgi:hypothetical protein
MARQRIEKTLIILDEEEVRRVLELTRQDDAEQIYEFVRDVVARRVKAALRKRCG